MATQSITSRFAASKPVSGLATGMASSQDSVVSANQDPEDCKDCETREVEVPEGAYLAMHLRRFIKHNGQIVKPNSDGLYVPADREEEEILDFFEKKNLDWVKKIG